MNLFKLLFRRIERYDAEHNFTCDICGREVFSNERVCAPCRSRLPWNDKTFCPVCGRKVAEAGICMDCRATLPKIEKARSVFTHEGDARQLVLRFKRGRKYLAFTLAELMLPTFEREFSDADALTFVPMTRRAEKNRGYNQSRLLAERLSELTQKPCLAVAEKTRETKAQKTLGRKDRAQNLKDCFRITDRAAVKEKRIVIVDDTFTTGSTVSELASRLLRAGATAVYAITVTSVLAHSPLGTRKNIKFSRKKNR